MAIYTTTKKQSIEIDSELGKGGEGVVYTLRKSTTLVAKIYKPSHRSAEKEQKLRAMIKNPPNDNIRKQSHISIAWPEELLYENGKFAGYLMPKIVTSPEIFEVFSPVTRKKKYPDFDWRYAHRAAQNLAISFNALHARGYVIGDVNQKNVLVTNNAMISLVDTDSFQVTDANGRVYRCPVGVSEYTPPELQGVSLETVNRFKYHDNFGLAILIFQLLMDGNHPFMGVPQNLQQSFGKVDAYCIKQGIFPYQSNRGFLPPPHAPRFEALHPGIQSLFLQTFVNGFKTPTTRVVPLDWAHALETSENALVQCKKNSAHWYSNHLSKCHWCEREKHSAISTQRPLTPSKPIAPRSIPPPIPAPSLPAKSSVPALAVTGGVSMVAIFVTLAIICIAALAIPLFRNISSNQQADATENAYVQEIARLEQNPPLVVKMWKGMCYPDCNWNETVLFIEVTNNSDGEVALVNIDPRVFCTESTWMRFAPGETRRIACAGNGYTFDSINQVCLDFHLAQIPGDPSYGRFPEPVICRDI